MFAASLLSPLDAATEHAMPLRAVPIQGAFEPLDAPGRRLLAARDGQLTVATAYSGRAAQRAGLSAGDALVAVDGLRMNERGLEAMLARRRPGERVRVHAFRRDELMEFEVTLEAPPTMEAHLAAMPRTGARAARLLSQWLGR
ncbi:MAG: PDZ domain-containing protein [Burkholderiales bacterium]|nr:PDZ domain-containing protein [Burkholderiales bacterium]